MFGFPTSDGWVPVNDSDVEDSMITQLAVSRSISRDEVVLELERAGGVIDSFEGLELAIEAEQTFGVSISDTELSSGICRSIPELAACVRSKLAPPSGPQGRQDHVRSEHRRR